MPLFYGIRNENFPRFAFMIKCNNIFYKKIFFNYLYFYLFITLILLLLIQYES